jgi:hypothetical protein
MRLVATTPAGALCPALPYPTLPADLYVLLVCAQGPIERFLASGGKLPIAVLAANRPEMLSQTLQSLLTVRDIRKSDILILQVSPQ